MLDISYNELPVTSTGALQMIPRLRELYMERNPVKSISNASFVGMDRLEVLDIRDFPLQAFEVIYMLRLQTLDFI